MSQKKKSIYGYQIKNFTGTVKDVDIKSGIVTGYFASFDNVDSDGDVFRKGVFKRSIEQRGPNGVNRIFHLLQHNILEPLSKPHILREDNKGLYFESKITKVQYGKDTIQLYSEKIFEEHSVGFRTITQEFIDEEGFNEITEAKLFEGSTVTLGANAETPFAGFKLQERIDLLTKAITNGEYTDDTFEFLLTELKQIRTLLDPSHDTQDSSESGMGLVDAFKSGLNQ